MSLSMDIKPEQINITKLAHAYDQTEGTHSWVYWALITLITEVPSEELATWIKPDDNGEKIVSIAMTINGKPAKFSKVIRRMKEQFERAVNERAMAIVEKRYNDELHKFEDAMDQVRKNMRDHFYKELGIECSDEDD